MQWAPPVMDISDQEMMWLEEDESAVCLLWDSNTRLESSHYIHSIYILTHLSCPLVFVFLVLLICMAARSRAAKSRWWSSWHPPWWRHWTQSSNSSWPRRFEMIRISYCSSTSLRITYVLTLIILLCLKLIACIIANERFYIILSFYMFCLLSAVSILRCCLLYV